MDSEVIFLTFTKLTGLSVMDASEYSFMCDAAAGYIGSRLKPDADIGKYEDALNFAAATSAYYRYVLWKLSDAPDSELRVGDILSKRNIIEEAGSAEQLCRQAFDDIRGILEDDGFVFTSVK